LKKAVIEAANEIVGKERSEAKRKDGFDEECRKVIEQRNEARNRMLQRKTRATVEE
jgi:hypothetical protein